ncbi:MAG: hypothetical protein HC829_05580 [Bacteroidales bacterium]|nr:hypothetical protein [Bacteroidales bacterium]
MRIAVEIDDLRQVIAASEQDVERAITSGMKAVTTGLKDALRQDVVSAGLGARLSRTWRGRTYPETGTSLDAAAYVWSKAPVIIDAFDRGVTIRSKAGFWLAIPTPAAGKTGLGETGGRKKITPGGWERRTGMRLRFVYRRTGPSLLVADDSRINKKGLAVKNRRKSGQATTVVFLLVPQVSLRKRLDIDAIVRTWTGRVPSLIAQYWTE